MSAAERLRRARTALAGAAAARTVLRAALAAMGVLALGAASDLVVALPATVRGILPLAAVLAAAAALARELSRGTLWPSLESVALWLEARCPELRYTLVTAVDPRYAARAAELGAASAEVRWDAIVARAASRAVAPPAFHLALVLAALLALPSGTRARVLAPRPGDALRRPALAPPRGSRLVPLVVTIAPPAYSGLREEIVEDPAAVAALVGSRVRLEGRGGAAGISARVGDSTLAVDDVRVERWSVNLVMPSRPALVRLADGAHARLVVLEPRPDSAPVVTLTAPARDSVFRAAAGSVALAADVADDLGLAGAAFEYIVSSGEGESFTFRAATLPQAVPGQPRRARLRATLSLPALGLSPGDVVHVRAVARDANAVSGPGRGASETRVFRIARAGEYDSVAVDGAAPPPVDKSVVSQRMLIILAERLERQRGSLARDSFLAESRRIAGDQKRLRTRVGQIIFGGAAGDEEADEEGAEEQALAGGPGLPGARVDSGAHPEPLTRRDSLLREAERSVSQGAAGTLEYEGREVPMTPVNRPLLEAFNAMWDAGRELDGGAPRAAIPFMRRALAAVQRARAAERVYLRGRPPQVIVDVGRARMQGKDRGAPTVRSPRPAVDDVAARLGARLARAIVLLPDSAAAAVDSLTVLRVDALAAAPPLAAALGGALDDVRAGRDATGALVRARRSLGASLPPADTLAAWGGP